MAIPWADAFSSATAYTAMWLMTRKKVESWHWWIATNISSIPLYFVKHYVFTSVYYIILLIIAIGGGALLPLLYGWVADLSTPQHAYWIVVPCYCFIGYYAVSGHKSGQSTLSKITGYETHS